MPFLLGENQWLLFSFLLSYMASEFYEHNYCSYPIENRQEDKKTVTTIGTTSTAVAFGITLKSKGNMDTNDTATAIPMILNTISAVLRNQYLS